MKMKWIGIKNRCLISKKHRINTNDLIPGTDLVLQHKHMQNCFLSCLVVLLKNSVLRLHPSGIGLAAQRVLCFWLEMPSGTWACPVFLSSHCQHVLWSPTPITSAHKVTTSTVIFFCPGMKMRKSKVDWLFWNNSPRALKTSINFPLARTVSHGICNSKRGQEADLWLGVPPWTKVDFC